MRIAASPLSRTAPALRGGASLLGVVCALALLIASPRPAAAGGLELLPGGTRSVARGGAVAARPEDALGLLHDPAGLAYLNGDQFTMDLDFALHEMCVDPYGYYGWGVYKADKDSDFGDPLELKNPDDPTVGSTYANTPLPKVCNSGTQFPVPNLAWVGKLSDDFALGLGFVAPTIATGANFGGHDGTIAGPDGNALPTPTRYAMIDQTADAFAPSVGAAYRIIPQLSLGVNLTLLMLHVKSRAVQNATSGTQPALDWLVDLEAQDYFLPSVTFSVHVKPVRGLDAMAALRWVDDFDGHGKVTFETNTYHQTSSSGSVPYRNDAVKLSKVRVGLPWAITAGVRYAGQLPDPGEKTKGLGDPLDTELWDVELDGTYTLNSRGSDTQVETSGDVAIITRKADGSGDSVVAKQKDIEDISVDRHLEDSIDVRLGGSYSVLPREVAVHAGGFYETRGIDPSYANIDSFSFARFGFGLGVMWRVGDFDLSAAYGHIFEPTMRIAPPPDEPVERYNPDDPTSGFDQRVGGMFDVEGKRVGGKSLPDPDAPSPGEADAVAKLKQSSVLPSSNPPPRIINAGEYTASFNIISVGAVYHW